MKKYVKYLPVVLYPYMYVVWMIFMFIVMVIGGELPTELMGDIMFWSVTLIQIITILSLIAGIVEIVKIKPLRKATKINLLIRVLQIPAYVFNFILGVIGFFLGIWGIGILIFVMAVDLITIILTGIIATGCIRNIYVNKVYSLKEAVLFSIGSFIYCVDLIIAVYVYVKLRKY